MAATPRGTPPDTYLLLLIEKLRAGECTASERDEIGRWAAADPVQATEVQVHLSLLNQMAAVPSPHADARAALKKINTQINTHIDSNRVVASVPTRSLRAVRGAIASALLVAGIVTGAGLWSHLHARSSTFTTEAANRFAVTLHDGTRVVLAPESRLTVSANFDRGQRLVEVSGEAYFTVMHDDAHPFTVRTARTLTRDVGTRFVVRDYPEDTVDRIGVEEGAVALTRCSRLVSDLTCRADAHSTDLLRGDIATAGDTSVVVTHVANLSALMLWLQNGLVFNNASVPQVVREIKRTFGVDVVVADSTLLKRHVTASFSGQPITVVLDIVAQTLGARYERTAHGFVIVSDTTNHTESGRSRVKPLTTVEALPGHA